MNDNFAVLLAPMGCYTQSHGSMSLQRGSQSFIRDPRFAAEDVERRHLIRAVLSVQRFTPEVEMTIRAHLRRFDLKDVWSAFTSDRRAAASREVFDRVHAAACGRANGTAVFASLVNP